MAEHRMTFTRVVLAAFTALLLAACGGKAAQAPVENEPREKKETILRADLLSKGGSAVHGFVSVAARKDRWVVSANITGATFGDYRVAFFDNGNCSSPNAFSAGKLWAPPETPSDPAIWVPLLTADTVGNMQTIARLPNPQRLDVSVFKKRSVLIFSGRNVSELKPGVRNEVVACGVFDTPSSLLDPLGNLL
jgi:Copper/zinc superoxide dismutase (SODC).